MSAADYDACESRLLVHEGSRYTDGVHPYDPGGPTRWGITLEDARLHWKRGATADDVRTMPVEVAKVIYRDKYWIANALNCDDLPAGVDDSLFDYRVNSGVGRADKVLRRVCGLADNVPNATLLSVLGKRDPKAVVNAINDERLKFLQTLEIWPTYKGGWTTRVAQVRAFSLQLAAGGAPRLPAPAPQVQTAPKGQVAKPSAAPVIVAGTGAAAASGGFLHWIGAHPGITVALLTIAAALLLYVVNRIDKSHQAKQEAPTPGIVPVPAS